MLKAVPLLENSGTATWRLPVPIGRASHILKIGKTDKDNVELRMKGDDDYDTRMLRKPCMRHSKNSG